MKLQNLFSRWKQFLRLVILLAVFAVAYFHIISILWTLSPETIIETINAGLMLIGRSVVVLCVLTLLSLDVRSIRFWYIELISIFVLLLLVGAIYYTVPYSTPLFFKLMAIIIFHLWIHVFLRYKHVYLTNRIINSSWWIAKYWVILYSLLMTLVVTLFMTVELLQQPLECEEVAEYVEETTQTTVINVQEWWWDLLGWSQRPVWEILDRLDSRSWWYTRFGSLIERVQEDQELVRLSFCEMIATLVQEKVGQWVWIIAVMIIMFLVLLPVLTLIYRLSQIIIWLLIKTLTLAWVYKREKRMRQVKELR